MEGEDGRILRRLGAKSSKLELRTIPGRGLEGKAARNAGGGDRQADPRDLGARIPGSDENLRPGRGRLDLDGVASRELGRRLEKDQRELRAVLFGQGANRHLPVGGGVEMRGVPVEREGLLGGVVVEAKPLRR